MHYCYHLKGIWSKSVENTVTVDCDKILRFPEKFESEFGQKGSETTVPCANCDLQRGDRVSTLGFGKA